MRVVVDTNIVLSGMFWGGIPAQVYDGAIEGRYTLLVTEDLIAELDRVLRYPKFEKHLTQRGLWINELVAEFRKLAAIVLPAEIPSNAVRDTKDTPILACAVGGQADFIVSGDSDLLALGAYADIPILTPTQFLERLP